MKQNRNENIVDAFYHDCFLHSEDKKIFKAHKVILASKSIFFHEYFQSRPGSNVDDVIFYNIRGEILEIALELIYKGNVKVKKALGTRLKWFCENVLKTGSIDTDEMVDSKIIQPSPKKMKYDNQIQSNDGNESIMTNWTQTSYNSQDLEKIKHFDESSKNGFKCKICTNFSSTFDEAKDHFNCNHATWTNEINVLKDCEEILSRATELSLEIDTNSKDKKPEEMKKRKMDNILTKLRDKIQYLGNFSLDTTMPKNLVMKAKDLKHQSEKIIKKIESYSFSA